MLSYLFLNFEWTSLAYIKDADITECDILTYREERRNYENYICYNKKYRNLLFLFHSFVLDMGKFFHIITDIITSISLKFIILHLQTFKKI